MVFSSLLFLFLFLPLILTVYFLLKRQWRNAFLFISSVLFYMWGEGTYVAILLLCIIFNYYIALFIEKAGAVSQTKSRKFVSVAIAFNLVLLIICKYANFFVDQLNLGLHLFSEKSLHLAKIHLPIGISFFTFQAISYVVDVYRKDVKATRSLINFAAYKSFFPQLLAGPIVRYRDIALQMTSRSVTPELFVSGINRFIVGLGKKVLIANTVAATADIIFSVPPSELSFGTAWLGLACYTLQIYFDFSGYSDMAIGMGRMFGFQFLENFNYPYTAVSIHDFWRRWHISLSTWFRDYLYIPLGGSRHSTVRTHSNLILVFFLCGFWHGASWTFVVWGLWHGLFLIVERLRNRAFIKLIGGPLSHLYVLLVVMIGWVFFRAESLDYALNYLKALLGLSVASTIPLSAYAVNTTELILASIVGIVGSAPIAKRLPILAEGLISRESSTHSANVLIAGTHGIMLAAVFLLSVVSLAGGSYNPFIYFRF